MADPERDADLERQPPSEADRLLRSVYDGDTLHGNDGRQLHGGIADDERMCALYDKIVSHPIPCTTFRTARSGRPSFSSKRRR